MDRPAIVTAALLGVVLIAVSLPFLFSSDGPETRYAITWSESASSSGSAQTGASGSTTTLRVPVTDIQPSNATIQLRNCNDAANQLQAPATLTWRLFEGSSTTPVDEGTASCADDGPFRVPLHGHADVAAVAAASAAAAEAQAYSMGDNRTVEYRLEFSWSRPPPTAGLPLPAAAFSTSVELAIHEWTATANEPAEGATR